MTWDFILSVPIQFASVRGLVVTADSQEQSVAVSFGGAGAGGTSVVGSLIGTLAMSLTGATGRQLGARQKVGLSVAALVLILACARSLSTPIRLQGLLESL